MEKPRGGTANEELCNVCRAFSCTVYSLKCQKLLLPLVNFKTEARTENHAASTDARGTSVGRGNNALEIHNQVTEEPLYAFRITKRSFSIKFYIQQ